MQEITAHQSSFRVKGLLYSFLMQQNPLQKVSGSGLAGCHGKDNFNQLLLCIFQFNSIQHQKDQHDMRVNPLVAVDKRMIADKAESKLSCFDLDGRIKR